MSAAPYSPSTLDRIKAGASWRDLGWDEHRYRNICARHRIEPCSAPKISAPPLLPQAADYTDGVRWHKTYSRAERNRVYAMLSPVQGGIFEFLLTACRNRSTAFWTSAEIAEHSDTTEYGVADSIPRLRYKLAPLGIIIHGKSGHGYRMVILTMHEGKPAAASQLLADGMRKSSPRLHP